MSIRNLLYLILIPLAMGCLGAFITINYLKPNPKTVYISAQPKPAARSVSWSQLQNTSMDFTTAAAQTVDAVVHVKTRVKDKEKAVMYDFFFGFDGKEEKPFHGSGSGVVVTSNGYIVTNNHVIENSGVIQIVLYDKRSFAAKLIGTDKTTDIALLKIEAEGLPFLDFGNSDEIKIGEWVLAVGNPFNLNATVTAGIVSAKARNINILQEEFAIESFIQTDAAVNPGNSGGALVNTTGDLIGINTAIASATGYFTGYSFAVPSNLAAKVVADLIEFGRVQRAYLGAVIQDLSSAQANKLKLTNIKGVYVDEVIENSAAWDAGLQAKDVILELNGVPMNKKSQLMEHLGKYRPGDQMKLLINRLGEQIELEVTLKNGHGTTGYIKTDLEQVLGATFEPLNDKEKQGLDLKYGMRVVEVNAGKFLKSGVPKGFIITHINKQPVKNMDDIQRLIDTSEGGVIVQCIKPNGKKGFYAFGVR